MCGIVGIVSRDLDVAADLVEGIRRLEYRGYDSCGVALLDGSEVRITKDLGGPSRLLADGLFEGLTGAIGLAHTRWATHGGVSRENAHPHTSQDRRVAIVHNGVINNYRVLRKELQAEGVTFVSETDSEVAAALIARELAGGAEPRDAVLGAVRRLEGTFALGVMMVDHPGLLWAARQESPLLVGFRDGATMLASDPMALGADCHEVLHPEDGELVELTADGCTLLRIEDGVPIERARSEAIGVGEDPELGEYEHYMAKEMAECSLAARAAMSVEDGVIRTAAEALAGADRGFLTGMGTAYHMALFGHYQLAEAAHRFCPAVTADELPDVVHFAPGDVAFGVSQSGETYDTLRALRLASMGGGKTLAISNVPASSMAREVDHVVLQGAGAEVAVLATKSALSQAVLLSRIAVEAGRITETLTAEAYDTRIAALRALPARLEECRETLDSASREVAARFLGLEKWFFLGRGLLAAVAMEGALKFKEVTYRHAEGMAAGFLKHGTISLIDAEMGTAIFIPPPSEVELRHLTMTALEEVRSRGGPVLAVGHLEASEMDLVDACIPTPGTDLLTEGLLQLVAGQYLSYHTAKALGRDVDRPRALAKSVTVP